MIFINYLVGFVEDNVGFFVLPRLIKGLAGCTDYIGFPTGYCHNLSISNQPFIFIPTYLLAKIANPVFVTNIATVGGLLVSLLASYMFFKKLFGRLIGFILSLTFILSPYFNYQSRSHFDLIQFWPVIWLLNIFFFSKNRRKPIILGLLLTLTVGISNYLGYFTIIFLIIYLLSDSFTKLTKRIYPTRLEVKHFLITIAVFVLTATTFLFPYIKSNFLSPRVRLEESTDFKAVNRPLEDFITFSSRPWYYILPSVDNPFFGTLSQDFLNRISGGGSYLTQNYFKSEHSASYLGWVNIILAIFGTVIVVRYKPTQHINFLALGVSVLVLIVITMPPYVTTSGFTFYTPSFVLFKFFPMFRVLSRAGVLILFFTLMFAGYGYKIVGKRLGYLFVMILALFSFAEFFIPPKITHVGTTPKVYAYLSKEPSLKLPIVVYPYIKTGHALFWMSVYKQPLINPKNFANNATGFISEDFTNLLATPQGLEQAHLLGAKYLVYFNESDTNNNVDFFSNSTYLSTVATFHEDGPTEQRVALPLIDWPVLIRIVEVGTDKSNTAILYKFR